MYIRFCRSFIYQDNHVMKSEVCGGGFSCGQELERKSFDLRFYYASSGISPPPVLPLTFVSGITQLRMVKFAERRDWNKQTLMNFLVWAALALLWPQTGRSLSQDFAPHSFHHQEKIITIITIVIITNIISSLSSTLSQHHHHHANHNICITIIIIIMITIAPPLSSP